jgi:hypothetical protein
LLPRITLRADWPTATPYRRAELLGLVLRNEDLQSGGGVNGLL